MRQHLANTVFRAVENGRPLMRVTNTGLTARIGPQGKIEDVTGSFQTDVRVWTYWPSQANTTYTKYGDWFVQFCAAITGILLVSTLLLRREIH
jgi:apolipoprotein N-acyltransferase